MIFYLIVLLVLLYMIFGNPLRPSREPYEFLTVDSVTGDLAIVDGGTNLVAMDGGGLKTPGSFGVDGALDVNSDLTVHGTTTANSLNVGSDLSVTGNQTVGGTLAVNLDQTVGGTLAVTGNQTVGGALAVAGNQTVTGLSTLNGDVTLSGNLKLKDDTTRIGGQQHFNHSNHGYSITVGCDPGEYLSGIQWKDLGDMHAASPMCKKF